MKTEDILTYTALFMAVLLFTMIYASVLIPVLRRYRAGQPILKIGPVWHMAKEGTPTMGGLSFIMALLTVFLLYALLLLRHGEQERLTSIVLIILFATLCGAIGFIDDYKKLVKKENQGLSAPQKYFLQLAVAACFLFVARYLGFVDTAIDIPFTEKSLELGFFYYPLSLLFLTGVVNALNLTDGLDGLLSGTVAVLAAFFLLYGSAVGEGVFSLFGVLLLGMSIGFLVFNHHPAKVFMGDTGSLFFGGLVAGVGLMTARPLTVLGMGGIYVIEAASVVLQVLYFKATHGKRLFLMAPLHHHFEKRGLSENAIVCIFAAVTALCCALMLWGG
ncbi:MAG: phospho-N-acetylmuramoyl-pentapeptide-transferase [Clostridia bacterium]|nr:phospho-N-acetylmuramoyl-pentapeptide-transferase [Clostridia bacterium]MBR3862640.1 phospho-N-acetylmuramoyl-pentapeptide-transferase [Clostridia bacterium]